MKKRGPILLKVLERTGNGDVVDCFLGSPFSSIYNCCWCRHCGGFEDNGDGRKWVRCYFLGVDE